MEEINKIEKWFPKELTLNSCPKMIKGDQSFSIGHCPHL